MSETFHVTSVKQYQVPDDTDTIGELRDAIADEDSVYREDDLEEFISSRKVLKRCDHCKSRNIIGRPCVIIFNRKAMVYEAVLCRECFLKSSEWHDALDGVENWFFVEHKPVRGAAFAEAIGDDPLASCYAIDGGETDSKNSAVQTMPESLSVMDSKNRAVHTTLKSLSAEKVLNIQSLLNSGEKIQAIKELREISGISLREAKDAIDAEDRFVVMSRIGSNGSALAGSNRIVQTTLKSLPVLAVERLQDLLKSGKKIEAIKELRQMCGISLKEAKDAIDTEDRLM